MGLFSKKIKLDMARIPRHIAFIMDGNGRWATRRGLPRSAGHRAGVDALKRVVNACRDLGVYAVSLYALSIENFNRSKEEIDYIFDLVKKYVAENAENLIKNDTRLQVAGNLYHERVPAEVREVFLDVIEKTKDCKSHVLQICFAYSGRDEIVRAVNKIIETGEKNIDEQKFATYLDTASVPDPDLIVRASGEQRMSNFLLWELSYSEFYFPSEHWPDFDEHVVKKSIYEFQKRNRRFGKA